MKQKLLLFLITTLMMTFSTRAADVLGSGPCGTNIWWEYTSDSVLTINSDHNGHMDNYDIKEYNKPWSNYAYKTRKIIIGKNVRSIGNGAFYDRYGWINLEDIEVVFLCDSLYSIGESAFRHYDTTYRFHINSLPATIVEIGDRAFEGVHFPHAVLPKSLKKMGKSVFRQAVIDNIDFKAMIPSIPEETFYEAKINKMTIQEGIQTICWSAFRFSAIKEITFPNSLTTIEPHAFGSCDSLRSLTLPDNIKVINDSVFYRCDSLTSVKLPKNLKTIGTGAFQWCNIKDISFSETLQSIGDNAFRGMRTTSLSLPNSVKKIGIAAFSSSSFQTVNLPESLTEIPDFAFTACSKIQEFNFGSRVVSIGEEAFRECSNLKAIELPKTLKTIGKKAFYYSGLWKVTIPKSVTKIGDNAFDYCFFVGPFYVEWMDPNLADPGNMALSWGKSSATVYVPKGTKALYEAHDIWKEFGNIIEYDFEDYEVEEPEPDPDDPDNPDNPENPENPDNPTIPDEPEEPEVIEPGLYLLSADNNWKFKKEYKFTDIQNGDFVINLAAAGISFNGEFKIVSSDSTYIYGGAGAPIANITYAMVQGGKPITYPDYTIQSLDVNVNMGTLIVNNSGSVWGAYKYQFIEQDEENHRWVAIEEKANIKYEVGFIDSEVYGGFYINIEPYDPSKPAAFSNGSTTCENYWESLIPNIAARYRFDVFDVTHYYVYELNVKDVQLYNKQFMYYSGLKKISLNYSRPFYIPTSCFQITPNIEEVNISCPDHPMTISDDYNSAFYKDKNYPIYVDNKQIYDTLDKYKQEKLCMYTLNLVENKIAQDVNGDGSIDTQDVLDVYNAMKNSLNSKEQDVNGDGSIDTQDVLDIYDYMKSHAKNRKDIYEE